MSADRKYLKDRPLKQDEIFVFAGQQEYRNNINPASRFSGKGAAQNLPLVLSSHFRQNA